MGGGGGGKGLDEKKTKLPREKWWRDMVHKGTING